MPERRTNQLARIGALIGLVAAFLLVVIVIATTSGDSDNGDGDETTKLEAKGPSAKGRKAVQAGVWIVREGDTLTEISKQTGIEIDDLVDLNPDADPQALISGQRINLRLE